MRTLRTASRICSSRPLPNPLARRDGQRITMAAPHCYVSRRIGTLRCPRDTVHIQLHFCLLPELRGSGGLCGLFVGADIQSHGAASKQASKQEAERRRVDMKHIGLRPWPGTPRYLAAAYHIPIRARPSSCAAATKQPSSSRASLLG